MNQNPNPNPNPQQDPAMAMRHKRLVADVFARHSGRSALDYERKRRIDISLVGAAYQHFQPAAAAHGDLQALFNGILAHQELTALEEQWDYTRHLLAGLQVSDVDGQLQHAREPRIYCTFHYGSYRLISYFLGMLGHDVCLAVTADVVEQQGPRFHQMHQQSGFGCRFQVLDAEHPGSIRKLMRALADGYSVVFYIDGNSGVGGMQRRDDSLACVPFLGRELRARKGIAFLSALAGVPVVPILTRRTTASRYELLVQPALAPPLRSNEAILARTAELFAGFEPWLQAAPEQWEAWLYLYKWIPSSRPADPAASAAPAPLPEHGIVQFDQQRYALVDYGRAQALLDKSTMRMELLQAPEHALLLALQRPTALERLGAQQELLSRFMQRRIVASNPGGFGLQQPNHF